MRKNILFLLFVMALWSCSSSDEPTPPNPDTPSEETTTPTDTPIHIDTKVSLDTAPKDYKGYVYKYNDLDYEYLVTLGFTPRCEYCTVPDDTLKRMTTEALAQSCMFWPVVGNHMYYPTVSESKYDGILISFDNCNVLQDLAKSENGAMALLKLYKYLEVDRSTYTRNWLETDITKCNLLFHKEHLELLLSTVYFTPKLSKEMLVVLANEAERLMLDCIEYDDGIAYWYVVEFTYILWQRVLLCYDKLNPILSDAEKELFENNIKYFELSKDKTAENTDLIAKKVRQMQQLESL